MSRVSAIPQANRRFSARMQVDFQLDEKDLVALAKYQMENSPKHVRRFRIQRWGLLAVFLVLALVTQFALRKPAVALYSAALGLILFGLYPFYYRWVIGRTLRQIVAARLNPDAFALRRLRLNDEGLEVTIKGKRTLIPWSSIGTVAMTSKYAFIATDGVFSQAIPRARVDEERFQRFVGSLRAGRVDNPAGGA